MEKKYLSFNIKEMKYTSAKSNIVFFLIRAQLSAFFTSWPKILM